MFLVMEHLAGQTLAERLAKGPLPLEQALTIATEIADALSAAHRQGVIHRDLKPANVMLTKAGAKLLDFGLAKLTGHGEQPAAAHAVSAVPTQAATLTGQGVIVGTLQYMAPEQLEGKPPDARTDLWALGAILYEMLTGKRAFEGTSAVEPDGGDHGARAAADRDAPAADAARARPPRAAVPREGPGRAAGRAPRTSAEELRWMREASGDEAASGGVRPRRRRILRGALRGTRAACCRSSARGRPDVVAAPLRCPRGAPVARLSLDVRPAEEVNGGGVPQPTSCPPPGGSADRVRLEARTGSRFRLRGPPQRRPATVRAGDSMRPSAFPLKGTERGRRSRPFQQTGCGWPSGAGRDHQESAAGGRPVVRRSRSERRGCRPGGLAMGRRAGRLYVADGPTTQSP